MLRPKSRPCPLACAGLVFLAAAAHAAPARAQQRDEAHDRQARAEYNAGSDAFGRGDFEAAVRRFEEAYRLSTRPPLLYNIGTSYDRLHRWREARQAFDRYLQHLPNAPNRDEVRARLRVIDTEIAHEEELAAAAARPPVVVVREGPSRVIVRTVSGEPLRPWRLVAYGAGGITIVAAGLAVVVGALGNDIYNQLAATCGMEERGCSQLVIDDIALRATLTNVAIGTAAVFAAGTIVAVVMDNNRPREPAAPQPGDVRVSVAPTRDNGGALVLSGVF